MRNQREIAQRHASSMVTFRDDIKQIRERLKWVLDLHYIDEHLVFNSKVHGLDIKPSEHTNILFFSKKIFTGIVAIY
jgi:hypothetical protein